MFGPTHLIMPSTQLQFHKTIFYSTYLLISIRVFDIQKYKKPNVIQAIMVHIGYHDNWETIIVWTLTFLPGAPPPSFCYKRKHLNSQYAWG